MYRHLGIGMRVVVAAGGTATTLSSPGLPAVLRVLLGLSSLLLWLHAALLVAVVLVTAAVRATGGHRIRSAPSRAT